jgi:hypothetical protein
MAPVAAGPRPAHAALSLYLHLWESHFGIMSSKVDNFAFSHSSSMRLCATQSFDYTYINIYSTVSYRLHPNQGSAADSRLSRQVVCQRSEHAFCYDWNCSYQCSSAPRHKRRRLLTVDFAVVVMESIRNCCRKPRPESAYLITSTRKKAEEDGRSDVHDQVAQHTRITGSDS